MTGRIEPNGSAALKWLYRHPILDADGVPQLIHSNGTDYGGMLGDACDVLPPAGRRRLGATPFLRLISEIKNALSSSKGENETN